MDKGPWVVLKHTNGEPYLQSDDFHFDVLVDFNGDFGSDEIRDQYAEWLSSRLNGIAQPVPQPASSYEAARATVKDIIRDLSDRSGIDMGSIDRETMSEIEDTLSAIVLNHFQ